MAVACREFGISRKTGYKIFSRYKDAGIKGLEDKARSPYRHPNKTPFQIEKAILGIKKEHSTWGAPKIREKLVKLFPMIDPPAVSTIHSILDRHGLVSRRRQRRYKAQGTPLSDAQTPNALWCAGFKGQFRLGNQQYCYPLTITDYRSRYLLACEGLGSTKEQGAFPVFERTFKEFGLPAAIRTDNGVPFASAHALFGLSKLAVWWLRLGIRIERIKPGCPQQNGRHERMHLTSRRRPRSRLVTTYCSNKSASTTSSRVTTRTGPTQALAGCIQLRCTHPPLGPPSTLSSPSTPVTNAPSKSPNVGAFVSGDARSTSVPSLQASTWGYVRSPTMFGLSALWITT